MGVGIHNPSSREQWLEMRRPTIGASEIAALFGAHPFTTAYALWAAKAGKLDDAVEETPAMRRGRYLEKVAVEFLQEERPTWRIDANPIPGGKFYRDATRRLSCTPDAFAIDPEREGLGLIQIKSVEPSVFRRKWKDEEGHVEPPLHVAIQAIQEASLTGASWVMVAPLVIGFGIDMPLLEVPLHAGLIGAIEERAREFWAQVESGEMPDPDWRRDSALAARLVQPEGSLDLSSDNEIRELLDERATLKERIRDDGDRCSELDGQIKNKIGAAAIATLPGWKLTFRTVDTREYTVAARKTRPLKIHRITERAEA